MRLGAPARGRACPAIDFRVFFFFRYEPQRRLSYSFNFSSRNCPDLQSLHNDHLNKNARNYTWQKIFPKTIGPTSGLHQDTIVWQSHILGNICSVNVHDLHTSMFKGH